MLWTSDLCRELIRAGFTGQRPTALFGGPHQSRPSFRRAGVAPGDRIFAVRAWRAALYPVCSMEVQRIVDYDRAGAELADEDYPKLIHWRPLKSGCISEVVLGPPGSPLRFDRPLPGEHLEHLTFTSRRGERKLKYVEDGRLLRALSCVIARTAAGTWCGLPGVGSTLSQYKDFVQVSYRMRFHKDGFRRAG